MHDSCGKSFRFRTRVDVGLRAVNAWKSLSMLLPPFPRTATLRSQILRNMQQYLSAPHTTKIAGLATTT